MISLACTQPGPGWVLDFTEVIPSVHQRFPTAAADSTFLHSSDEYQDFNFSDVCLDSFKFFLWDSEKTLPVNASDNFFLVSTLTPGFFDAASFNFLLWGSEKTTPCGFPSNPFSGFMFAHNSDSVILFSSEKSVANCVIDS